MSVTVHGPLAPTTAHCDFVPPDNWEELATTDDTTTADPVRCTSLGHNTPTLTLSNAVESTTMAVAVTWPPGTYTRLGVNDIDVDPTPTNDDTEAPEFDPTWTENIDQQIPGSSPWPMILIVTAIAGGLIVTLIAATRRRPDQRCAQAPAGDVTWVADHPGAPITTTYDLPTGPRRATPPPGITVAVAGALMSKELRARDVTGMLLTLAHRGHIHMSKSSPGWTLTRLSPNDPVTTAEQALLDAFFAHTDTVHLTSIAEQLAPNSLKSCEPSDKTPRTLVYFDKTSTTKHSPKHTGNNARRMDGHTPKRSPDLGTTFATRNRQHHSRGQGFMSSCPGPWSSVLSPHGLRHMTRLMSPLLTRNGSQPTAQHFASSLTHSTNSRKQVFNREMQALF